MDAQEKMMKQNQLQGDPKGPQDRRDLLPKSSMGFAKSCRKQISKGRLAMTEGDVSTDGNEAASQR